MRKRVLLKSPLRENRTAGSVRGASGNWRSYRDNWVIVGLVSKHSISYQMKKDVIERGFN